MPARQVQSCEGLHLQLKHATMLQEPTSASVATPPASTASSHRFDLSCNPVPFQAEASKVTRRAASSGQLPPLPPANRFASGSVPVAAIHRSLSSSLGVSSTTVPSLQSPASRQKPAAAAAGVAAAPQLLPDRRARAMTQQAAAAAAAAPSTTPLRRSASDEQLPSSPISPASSSGRRGSRFLVCMQSLAAWLSWQQCSTCC